MTIFGIGRGDLHVSMWVAPASSAVYAFAMAEDMSSQRLKSTQLYMPLTHSSVIV